MRCEHAPSDPVPAAALSASAPEAEAPATIAHDASPVLAPTAAAPLTLVFGGDAMASGHAARALREAGPEGIWNDVRPLFRSADLAVLNLETALAPRRFERRAQVSKEFTFRSPNEFADALSAAGIDVVSLANNHVCDFGLSGLEATRAALRARGIEGAGAGANEAEAYAPVVREVAGRKVAVVALSRVVPVGWGASAERGGIAGVASFDGLDRAAEAVRAASRSADVTVAFLHWGLELSGEATGAQRRVAERLIDAGADMVIGAHPHVVQGLDSYRGKLIAYSLGNLLFTVSQHDEAHLGLVLSVSAGAADAGAGDAEDIRLRAIPVLLDAAGTHLAAGDERARILSMLAARSHGVVWESEDVAAIARDARGGDARAARQGTARQQAVTRAARIGSRNHSSSE